MSTDQRRALAATTPTTEVIKDAVTYPRERLGEPLDISPERFEAWLAGVKRYAAREALDGLAAVHDDGTLIGPHSLVGDAARHHRDTHYPEETP